MLSLFGAMVLLPAAGGGSALAARKPAPKKAAPAAKVNPAPYIQQLSRIGGDLRDFQALVDARMGEPGKKPMTFKVRLGMKMPDSVRMDVLSSSNGLFRGWKLARVGNSARLYDPISERSTSTDLSRLTGKQPIRMDLGVDMFAGIFRPRNYTVVSAVPAKLNGQKTVQLRLKPKPGFNNPDSVVKLSHILVWMDPAKKVPLKQESYGWLPKGVPGVNGNRLVRLVEARFSNFKPAGGGVWYPTLVQMVRERPAKWDDSPNSVRLRLTRVNGVLVPQETVTVGGETNQIRFSNIRVNTGLTSVYFNPR